MVKNKKSSFHCKSEKQKKAIAKSYAKKKSGRIEAPYPHFRYYKKSKHPALIVGEQPVDEDKYRKVMHGEKDGSRNNEIVYPNPDKRDNEPMYIGKRTRHDKKDNFENVPLPWKYPQK